MKKKLPEIPIFFAVDDNYVPCLAVSIKSLIANSSKDYYYSIKILYTDISEEHQKSIEKFEQENVGIEFVDLNYYIEKIKDKLFTRDYYSKTTYFRLFIPNLYPQYSKALYLDSDVIVLSDIANLYNIDMEDNLVAAAPDEVILYTKVFSEYAEKVVGVSDYRNYFNAGVLLMNLDELKKIHFQDKFMRLLETIKFTVAQDQDYLNRLCKGRVKLIDGTWNKMPSFCNELPNENLNLIHYNLAYKPWHFEDIAYKDYFWEYAKQTEYFEEFKRIQENYSEEEKFADMKKHEKLMDLAKEESDCVGDDRINRRK